MSGLADTLLNIGSKVAGGLIRSNPIGAGIMAIVDSFSGEGDKLPENATAEDVIKKIEGLSSEDKAKVMLSYNDLMAKQYEKEMLKDTNETNRFKQMEITNRVSKVRPMIVVAFTAFTLLMLTAIGGAVAYRWAVFGVMPDDSTSWQFFLFLLYIPMHVIFKYFDIRTDEKKAQLASMLGNVVTPKSGIADIFVAREKRKEAKENKEAALYQNPNRNR